VHLARTDRFAEAREFAQIAVDTTQALVALSPESAGHRSQLGASLSNLARLELHDGRAAHALELLDAARLELNLAIQGEPKNTAFAGQLRQWHVARVQTLLALARWSDVLAQLDEFETQHEDLSARSWAVEQRVACLSLARDALALETDGPARIEALSQSILSRLRSLIEGGYDRAHLGRAKWLDPLREHAGLTEILSPAGG
jgi:hypothetical protein